MDYKHPLKIRPASPPGRRARHTAALLSVAIVAAIGIVAAGKAPSAWACGDTVALGDCRGIGLATGGDNYGEYADINISCLYMPNPGTATDGNFVTNEIWDANHTSRPTNWIETGALSGGLPPYNGYYNRELFYGYDVSSGYGFHTETVQTAGDASYPVEIAYEQNSNWDVYVNGKENTVTGQPLFPNGAATEAGTEYTAPNSSDGIRDVGSVSNIEWENSKSDWYLEGTAMKAVPTSNTEYSGTSAWIAPSYNSSTSTVSWAGPC